MGTIFGGMTLKRWGLAVTRFVLPQMEKIQNFTSEGTKKVLAMQSSFEFLKFSMFETFTQTPLFREFVELMIAGSNALSAFVSEHPIVTSMAAILGGVLIAVGSLLGAFGGIFQFIMLRDAITALKGVDTAVATTTTNWSALGKVMGVGFAIGATISAIDLLTADDLTAAEFFMKLGQTALFTALGAKFLGAGVYTIPITLAVVFGLTFGKIFKEAPRILTKQEFGISDAQFEELQKLPADPRMGEAFQKGFQGSVLPAWASTVTEMTDKLQLVSDAGQEAMVTGDNSLTASIKGFNTEAVTLIDGINTDINNAFKDRTMNVTVNVTENRQSSFGGNVNQSKSTLNSFTS
jgi:hypothetical protein